MPTMIVVAKILVRTHPGQTTLTLTPISAPSMRSERDSPTTPCLAVLYGALSGVGTRPAPDAVFTM
jgi:hypothetical protein